MSLCARGNATWHWQSASKLTAGVAVRFNSGPGAHAHETESFEAFNNRYHSFFTSCNDLFELQRGLNNCFAYDLVPTTEVIDAALKCARKVNDYATAVRILEGVKEKVENKGQYQAYLDELKPTIQELGTSPVDPFKIDHMPDTDFSIRHQQQGGALRPVILVVPLHETFARIRFRSSSEEAPSRLSTPGVAHLPAHVKKRTTNSLHLYRAEEETRLQTRSTPGAVRSRVWASKTCSPAAFLLTASGSHSR